MPDDEVDDDGDGYAECEGDCNDADPGLSPGLPELGCDGKDNDCDPATPDILDADGDTYVCDVDCDDTNGDTYPGAWEVNDAADNQCPGEPGFRFVDEISGTTGFANPADPTELCWPAQGHATDYEVLRSGSPDFSGGCLRAATAAPCWHDPEVPPPGGVYHYLVRSMRPSTGSLGWSSAVMERNDLCGFESSCSDRIDNDLDSLTDCQDPDCLGIGRCLAVSFRFQDTPEDDLAATDVHTFLSALQAFPTDFMNVRLESGSNLGWRVEWCAARADWYRERYLELAPASGSAWSGTWDKWYRTGFSPWIGPETTSYSNTFGMSCFGPYSWCSDLRPGLFGVAVAPDEFGLCEARDVYAGCGDGKWLLTLDVGVNWNAACGASIGTEGDPGE